MDCVKTPYVCLHASTAFCAGRNAGVISLPTGGQAILPLNDAFGERTLPLMNGHLLLLYYFLFAQGGVV